MRRTPRRGGGITRIIALTIAGVLIIGAIVAGFYPLIAHGENQYSFELSAFDSGIQVTQRITYTNDTGGALDAILFDLPANAYRRTATTPVFDSEFEDAYPSSFTPGGVEFYSVLVNGEPADYGLSGAGETNLRVACNLAPGESCAFTFLYDVVPPESRLPLGANLEEIRLAAFYPYIGVYDGEEMTFSQYPPSAYRSATFAHPADFTLDIFVPQGFTVAAPGSVEAFDGGFRVTLKSARDLSVIIKKSASFATGYDDAGTEISVSATDGPAARRSVTFAARTLNFFASRFGDFPGERIVITAADVLDAASYSGMIVIPAELFRFKNRYQLERAIAGGVARQYFGLSSMNDPEKAPWIDEALCSYGELLYVESAYGEKAFLAALNERVLSSLTITVPGYVHVDSELSYFSSKQEYELMVRGRGTAIVHVLREILGDDAFSRSLRLYAETTAGGTPTMDDLIDAVNAADGGEIRFFLEDLLRSIGDYVYQNLEQFGG